MFAVEPGDMRAARKTFARAWRDGLREPAELGGFDLEAAFDELEDVDDLADLIGPPPSGAVAKAEATREDKWVRDRRGRITWCHANAQTVLVQSVPWRGVLAWNEFTQQMVLTDRIPDTRGRFAARELRDSDVAAALAWFNRNGFPDATDGTLRSVMDLVARDNIISPVRHYLDDVQWDGRARLDTWLIDHCGAEDSGYVRAVGRAWLISAVARALRPGCKADHMLVLEGAQGIGKSTAVAALCGAAWFSDSLPDMHSKDASTALRGKWILEIGELSAMRRSDVEGVKQFISRQEERYRPPYGRAEVVEPRRCVFVGTVNPRGSGYLLDDTGARRFWLVACTTVDPEGLTAARDQLWAEAVAAFRGGESWHLDRDTEAAAQAVQADRSEDDAWSGKVLITADRLASDPENAGAVGTKSIMFDMGWLLREITKADTMRVAGILTRGGWRQDGRFRSRTHPDYTCTRFVRA